MAKEDLKECLNHSKKGEARRKLVAFCSEPKTYVEMTKAGIKGELFQIVGDLKTSGALSFEDGKYVSTEQALDVLKSID